jgi:hypothetical protein
MHYGQLLSKAVDEGTLTGVFNSEDTLELAPPELRLLVRVPCNTPLRFKCDRDRLVGCFVTLREGLLPLARLDSDRTESHRRGLRERRRERNIVTVLDVVAQNKRRVRQKRKLDNRNGTPIRMTKRSLSYLASSPASMHM